MRRMATAITARSRQRGQPRLRRVERAVGNQLVQQDDVAAVEQLDLRLHPAARMARAAAPHPFLDYRVDSFTGLADNRRSQAKGRSSHPL